MYETESYYLVVDLEATCDDRHAIPRDESETIEIGAVLCDGRTFEPIDELQTFVRPVVHPTLTAFCTELTTITQSQVDDAPGFPDAAALLAAFGKRALFCSWGAYDRNQLERDARRHGIASPLGPRHVNLKERFAHAAGDRRSMGNQAALHRCGLVPAGTHHRGIDDARNIARLLPYALGALPIPTREARRPDRPEYPAGVSGRPDGASGLRVGDTRSGVGDTRSRGDIRSRGRGTS